MGSALLLAAGLLGFVLPGWGLATLAGSPARACAAFLLSLIVLFEGALLCQVIGVPITASTIGLYELTLAALLLGAAARRRGGRVLLPDAAGTRRALAEALAVPHGRILVACVLLVGVILAVRYCVQPLSGLDTSWRWDLLARQLLVHRAFDFYPPRSAADYRMYFFPDAIPPLVSVTYWWLYAAYGGAVPELTGILVVAQYACATVLTFHLGKRLLSPRAGVLAAAILASSPLFYRATFVGQETGLTVASFAGMLLFACTSSDRTPWSGPILAGAAAGIGALSREYGWTWVLLGVLTLAWRGAGLVPMLALAATAIAVAGPWYLRTWQLTGNPLYPLAVGPFDSVATNPLFAATLEFLHERWMHLPLSVEELVGQALFVLSLAPVAIPVGVATLVCRLRRDWLLAVAAVVLVGLWVQSIPYTQGGFRYATRVLGPAVLVLSVAAATGIARGNRRWHLWAGTVAVCVATLWTIRNAAVFPAERDEVPWSEIPKVATERTKFAFLFREQGTLDALRLQLPAGSRILGDNNYAWAALRGSEYELVPLWSPEFSFMFDMGGSAEEVDRKIRERGVRGLLIGIGVPVNELYGRYPFFRNNQWQGLVRLATGYALFVPSGAAR